MNNRKFIKSVKTGKRNPAAAFIMSLFITGLGQIYNGRFSVGIVLVLLRAVSEFMVPAYMHARPESSYIGFVASSALFNILISAVSPLEALIYSIKNREVQLKRWNSPLGYISFALITITVLLSGIIINSAFLKIMPYPGKNSSLLFKTGDIVLVKKYTSSEPGEGDFIIYHDKGRLRTSRIIGGKGDRIEISSSSIILNMVPYKIGIPDEKIVSSLDLADLDDLYLEKGNTLSYPVLLDFSDDGKKAGMKTYTPGDKELLVSDDKRKKDPFFRIIKNESVEGRIEGVIFSKKPERILLKPYINPE